MTRSHALKCIRIVAGGLLLAGFMLAGGSFSSPALAQELPPRPTLTAPSGEEPDEPDDDQPSPSPTPAATATLAPTPPTPTPAPPPPAQMPETGGPAGSGPLWVALAIGVVVAALAGIGRALRFLINGKRAT